MISHQAMILVSLKGLFFPYKDKNSKMYIHYIYVFIAAVKSFDRTEVKNMYMLIALKIMNDFKKNSHIVAYGGWSIVHHVAF